jgi:cytochrome c oxidase cbb3-type subunit III
LEDIQQTVTHGIRGADPAARQSQMPRFGTDGMLKPLEVQQVADFVWTTFWGHPTAGRDVSAGAKIFADNCVQCHGDKGQGNREVGGPRLASQVHLHGNDEETILDQVTLPRMGVMPNWGARLDPATIKAVTLYVHSLGGGE